MAHADPDGAGPSFSVLTLNVWFFSDPWWFDPPRGAVPDSAACRMHPAPSWPRRRALILRLLEEHRPDLVALQETGRDGRWHLAGPDQGRQLAEAAGYRAVYHAAQWGSSPRTPHWEYGLSLLSRHPVLDAGFIRLPHNPQRARDVRRICQAAVVRFPWGELALLNAHFSLDPDARLASARAVLAYADRVAGSRPCVIAGDLNALPRGRTLAALTAGGAYRDAWRAASGGRPGPTFPSHRPSRTLDYVLAGQGLHVRGARLVGDRPDALGYYPSDHLGVLANLSLAAGGRRWYTGE
ncbi:MAG TPA: endonuclease/exonuclease/phosphatase family protein [Dehalococcoidia bacterium]